MNSLGLMIPTCNAKLLFTVTPLFHLRAHVVNRLEHKIRKPIPKAFNSEILFKKCNPLDFKFYLGKFFKNNKKSPYCVCFQFRYRTKQKKKKKEKKRKKKFTLDHMKTFFLVYYLSIYTSFNPETRTWDY